MADDDAALTLDVLRSLLDRGHLATPGGLPQVVSRAAATVGWAARVYVVDLEQRVLVPAPVPDEPDLDVLAIDGTLAGRAFQRLEPVRTHGTSTGLWLPIVDGVDRLGALSLTVPDGTNLSDPAVEERYRLLSHLTGHLMAAKSSYGDGLHRLARRRPRSVASELLWDLLPPRTFGCEGLVISGILEPCYDVAADAFDYGVVDRVAHLAILDATGHDLHGTVVAAVALAALRNARRDGRSLYDAAQAVDDVVREQGQRELFATGFLGELDLGTGRLRYLNAGHPAPLLLRRGKVVKQLDEGRRILFGLGTGEAVLAEEWLEPDDLVVLYTDGVTEARDPDGGFFGLDRLTGILERSAAAGLTAPETLRRATQAVLEHQHGTLQDDATLLVAHWASGEETQLSAS